MTINESANLPDLGGSKTVEPSDIDNPETLNFWEPEEEQANPAQGGDGIADETDAADDQNDDDGQESDGSADEDADSDEDGDGEPTADDKLDETLVTLKGGEQVPVKELKLGYMRERDYRLKTQETANKSRGLEEMSNRVVGTATAIANFLISQMPAEPSHMLAMQNPAEYTRQKAVFDVAAQRVNQILEMANVPKQVSGALTNEQRESLLATESAKLAEAFPQTATDDGREAFFQDAFATARELGWTDEEMRDVTDHRYFKLAHYARLGMQAERAKKKALEKVTNAPPAVPPGKARGQNAQQARKNQDAMARLTRTGSLKDAMNIDF